MEQETHASKEPGPVRSLFARLFSSPRQKQNVPERAPAPPADQPAGEQVKKALILVVDDDPIILKTTSIKLKSHGYSVITATEASQVIGILRKEKVDLILLDINFPPDVSSGATAAWNGFGIMAWARALYKGQSIPVIVITGTDTERNRQRALAEGAVAFFPKPIDHARLVQVIDQELNKKASAPEAGSGTDFQV